MASSANPDLWSDLSDLNGGDACAALLRINAEMFAAAPARDRESIATFEALALGFLPKASGRTLNEIARILATCPDTPLPVAEYLRRHAPGAHELQAQPRARAVQSRELLLATAEGRTHLASAPDLDAHTIDRLLVLREEASEDVLAANPAFSPAASGFHRLVRRALDRPALARILLQRDDLSLAHEACLYLAADRDRRGRIRERIARIAVETLPAISLSKHDVDGLLASAAESDVACFESRLTRAFGFSCSTQWRILQFGRHLLLPLALKALDLPDKAAIRIFLTLHPALCHPLSALRGLVREMRDVPSAVALFLVETILGVKALSADDRIV
ncbi:MAG TPA: hypothetical protein VEZ24_19225 [Microvirga sp.]|nr:hypothetical protein [Microvirga sp.]